MEHVVHTPRAPFRTANGSLEVHQLLAWQDNLVWLLVCTVSGDTAVVDGPEAETVLAYCQQRGLRLTTVLNTHTHGDHVGINRDLAARGLLADLRVIGPALRASEVPGLTRGVDEDDEVDVGRARGRVLRTEGHIDGHISFLFDDALLCGDTLFAGGCGYLFDGPPAKMFDSLNKLVMLDDMTRVCCAHEYTQDNLRFAWSVEPENTMLAERIRQVWALRARGECAVPSTLADERATNPFLRFRSPDLRRHVQAAWPDRRLETDLDFFAATRALKDRKTYRQQHDDVLPL
jgi:hydroxyacylglutathione hydrolase